MKSILGTGALALMLCGGCAAMGNQPADPAPPSQSTGPAQVFGADDGVVPVGQELDVRLQSPLSSETAEIEQRFETTTVVDLMQDGDVLIPAGSMVRGLVSSVQPAGRLDRSGRLTLSFDQLSVNGRTYRISAMPTEAFESGGIRDEVETVGAGGVVGAIVGGILGGVKGALLGAAVGAGGVVAATDGEDAELPAGTVIRIRMDAPIELR
jgi:hypothetical protein